jgi:hypothetical protein
MPGLGGSARQVAPANCVLDPDRLVLDLEAITPVPGDFEPSAEQIHKAYYAIHEAWGSLALCEEYLRCRRRRDPRALQWAIDRLILRDKPPRSFNLVLLVAGDWPGPQAMAEAQRRAAGPVYPPAPEPTERLEFLKRQRLEEEKRRRESMTDERRAVSRSIVERVQAGLGLDLGVAVKEVR